MLLIILIGGKVLVPAFSGSKQEKIISTGQGDDDSEKKTENDPLLKKEQEAIGFCYDSIAFLSQQADILHYTAYKNNYKSSYYSKITIPPPDSI